MLLLARHWIVVAALLAADVAPEPQSSCGCDSPPDDLTEVVGTATITKIAAAPSADHNCSVDPVRVEFDFISDSGTNGGGTQRLFVGDGLNPARSFVERKGITVGSSYGCVKQTENGAVTYRFPGMDLSDYASDCFGSR